MSLITRADAKKFLEITDNSQDSMIDMYIASAEKYAEKVTGRVLVEKEVTQKFEGSGLKYFDLDNLPATMLDVTDPLTIDGEEKVLDTDFYLEEEDGLIHLDSGVFSRGVECVVKYKAGYKSAVGEVEGNVPEDLKFAMLMLVSVFYNSSNSDGGKEIKAESFGDYSVTFGDPKASKVNDILNLYKLPND